MNTCTASLNISSPLVLRGVWRACPHPYAHPYKNKIPPMCLVRPTGRECCCSCVLAGRPGCIPLSTVLRQVAPSRVATLLDASSGLLVLLFLLFFLWSLKAAEHAAVIVISNCYERTAAGRVIGLAAFATVAATAVGHGAGCHCRLCCRLLSCRPIHRVSHHTRLCRSRRL